MIEVKRKPKRTVLVSLGNNNIVTKKLKWNEINSYEDACSNLGIDPNERLKYQTEKHLIALIKLETIIKAVNEGWTPDWKYKRQKKYFCWFDYKEHPNHKPEATENGVSSSLRFSMNDCHYCFDLTSVGSHVCFVTEEKALYVGEKFIDLYNDYLSC